MNVEMTTWRPVYKGRRCSPCYCIRNLKLCQTTTVNTMDNIAPAKAHVGTHDSYCIHTPIKVISLYVVVYSNRTVA